MAMRSEYAKDYSPCCDAAGHRPNGTGGTTYFCMDCGATFESTPA
jgi:hypothetical protein